jgi:hypothetical protein
VDKKWLLWKAKELDRQAQVYDMEIAEEARKGNSKYFIATASSLGLCCMPADGTVGAIINPAPTLLVVRNARCRG